MSNKRIIIRNCPCFVEGIAIKGNEQKTQTCNNHKVRELTYCADITDCVIKQIVERCKKVRESTADICTNPYEYATYCETRGIFELLDIQEVE